ncbi:MAG TPA: DSD1 family PLP-dependent enzyme [Alphaproteobacteria bacterium]|nr:DSD1 family PLP-dependent enzyme [Alphaproteobacteria bacterium]
MSDGQQLGPNRRLIGVRGSRARLTTPALVLDLDRFERNLTAMARYCRDAGLELRPHAKTHKCSAIAGKQIEAGAVGVCCATLREAEAMVAGGVRGVHITSPVVGDDRIERLAALNIRAHDLMIVVDNPANARDIEAAVRRTGRPLRALVDVDVGMSRTGVASGQDALALARQLAESEELEYCGIQGYSGRVQHINDIEERRRVYGDQMQRFAAIKSILTQDGLEPEIVTGGGTGTFGIDRTLGVLTEHQAGSYIFMDVEYNLVHIFEERKTPFETTLFMRNTVVSANAGGFVTIDGGFKCFATDGPLPEIASGAPAGARYDYFGDEHGRIVFANGHDQMPVGAGVEIVTPHCDPTVNLHDWYHVVRGDTLLDIWPIDARGVL